MSEEQQTTGDHQKAAQAGSDPTGVMTLAAAIKLAQQASEPRKVSAPDPLSRVVSQGAVGQGRYIPTLSLDPANVTAIDDYDDHKGYVQCAVDAFSTTHSALHRLSDAREQVKKDTSKTEANQILCIAAEAGKLQDAATRKFDAARKTLTDAIAHTDALLSKPLHSAADNRISGEVRDLCRSMSASDREKFISEAMKDRDTTVLNAILGAPAALSGLSKQMLAHHTRAYHEMMTPDVAARLKVMRNALDLVESRAGLVFGEIEKALGARWDVVQRLRKTQDAASQALLLINNPVQP